MATTYKPDGVEKFTLEQQVKLYKNVYNIHKANLSETKKLRSTLRKNDFSGYRAKFDTKKVKKQITRSYGSVKSGNIGVINGFKAKDESWRMLNVLTHDRYLHQRYSRTLVKKTHDYEDNSAKIRREVRRLLK